MPSLTRETSSPKRSRHRDLPPLRVAAALVAASLLACAAVFPAGAADEVPIVGSETLIGELIPITGDPIETRSVDLRIEFHRNSAEITERAAIQLRELGTALTSEALRDADLALYGHTDSSGPTDYNQALSERRARAVAAFLQAHFSIGEERLREVRGHGESQPREDLPPSAADQRRVEIVTFHERPPESAETSEGVAAPAVEAPEHATSLPEINVITDSGISESAAGNQAPSGDDETETESGYIVIE